MQDETINPLAVLLDLVEEGNKDALAYLVNITREVYEEEGKKLDQQIEAMLPSMMFFLTFQVAKGHPKYLPLPKSLALFENETRFQVARHHGRLWYRTDGYMLDEETLETVRNPYRYTRQDIYDLLDSTIRIQDVHTHVAVPLAYRVGVMVGWLSALSVSQKDDAQAGMVMLATLVHPFLSPPQNKDMAGTTVKAPHRRKK